MIRMHWAGDSNVDIAAKLGYTEQMVSNVLNSPESKEILAELKGETLDTMAEVQQEIALAAPLAIKRKIDLMYSGDDRVANSAATDILHMNGHAPVKRVQIDRGTAIEKKYEALNEDELRHQLEVELGLRVAPGTGPDGRPLN
jgi:hypothetical protein